MSLGEPGGDQPPRAVSAADAAPGVRILRLARPDVLNAINTDLVDDLRDELDRARNDDGCAAVVLTGAGRAFCAGLDVNAVDIDAVTAGPAAALRFQRVFSSLIREVYTFPLPLIAAVNGAAYGGGLALAMACDIRLASSAAQFTAGFANLGLGGTELALGWLLPRTLGRGPALEFAATGRTLDAAEALRIRLVDRVSDPDGLLDDTLATARAIASHGRLVASTTKTTLRLQNEVASIDAGIEFEDRTQALLGLGGGFRAYVEAYRERRSATSGATG